MVRLHRVFESAFPITKTSQIKSLTSPPPGWVELDLTGMDTSSSGLKSGVNKGVYIHKDDLNLFRSNNDNVINYRTIVGHSYGDQFRNSLTYKPSDKYRDSGIIKRVAIPKPFVSKLKSYRYLAAVDSYMEGFGLIDWVVYTNSFQGASSLKVPKNAYERRSTQQFAEYECMYLSLRDLSKADFIFKKEEKSLSDDELLNLVSVLFYQDIKWKSRLDKDIVKNLRDDIEKCIDTSLFSSMEDVVKEIPKDELDMGIFSKQPTIKKYTYTFNLYTVQDFKDFVLMMGGAAPSVTSTLDNPNTDRLKGVTYFILDSRDDAPHPIACLTRDSGIVGIEGVCKDYKNCTIVWDGDKISTVQ